MDGGVYYKDDPSNKAAGSVVSTVSKAIPVTSTLLSTYSIVEASDPITGVSYIDDPLKRFTEPTLDIFINVAPFVPLSFDVGWIIFQSSGGFPQNNCPLNK